MAALLPILTTLALALVLHLLHRRHRDPLRDFPGPFWASRTYLWRLYDYATGMGGAPRAVALHREYGDVARTGPRTLSFSSPQAVRDIYGTDRPLHRSDWYLTFAATSRGQVLPTLFATADTAYHDGLKRAVAPAFSLSALVSYEPFVTGAVAEFMRQLRERFAADDPAAGTAGGHGRALDLPRWMHWYAFDVVGELTYGARFGFMETASDVGGIIRDANDFMSSNLVVSAVPGLDGWLRKNPVLLWLNRRGYFNGRQNPVVAFALKNRARRDAEGRSVGAEGEKGEGGVGTDDGREDLLHKFIQAKDKYPDTISEREVLGLSLSMIFAGSESTGTTLTALFYYLLKNAGVYRRLREEIDAELPLGEGGTRAACPPVGFREAFALRYLDACVKETFRMHPAARFAPERVLPSGGARIAGHDVPGGTVVGVNAWALHRREDVFGARVDEFTPERWLPADGSVEEAARVEGMNHQLFHFGAGKFGCIGRNISLMEIYKVVPSLLRRFDFTLDDAEKEWRFVKGGFVNIADVDVRIKVRED